MGYDAMFNNNSTLYNIRIKRGAGQHLTGAIV